MAHMSYNDSLRKALKFAATKHAGQLRKGTNIPYLVHPVEVAMILSSFKCQTDVAVAGYLHDTLEDTDTTYDEIAANFGTRVASIVAEVTAKDKTVALAKATTYSPYAVMVKTADLICNISDIADDYAVHGDAVFDRFKNGKDALKHYDKMICILLDRTKYTLPVYHKVLGLLLTKLRSIV
jgi:(p)ppGpp synthase/HD superfamily hydrolase